MNGNVVHAREAVVRGVFQLAAAGSVARGRAERKTPRRLMAGTRWLPALLAIALVYASPALGAGIFRVDAASTATTPDGQTWATAYPTLQAGVDAAKATGSGEVWVRAGTYTATTDPVLTMKVNVSLYGGFAGTESTREERDWAANVTIIDGQDARRCVNGTSAADLDGFTVTRGRAVAGGGIYNYQAASDLTNCTFTYNTATGGGSSGGGGAMYTYNASLDVTNCVFIGNVATVGGAAYSGINAMMRFLHCTFTGNVALIEGGGIGSDFYTGSLVVWNCILWGDTAPDEPEMSIYGALFVTHSCIQGGCAGTGNIDAAPLFVDADSGGSVQLREGSPCIDAGDSSFTSDTDILGRPRPQGADVDMGAYEGGVTAADIVSLNVEVSPVDGGRTIPVAGTHLYTRGEFVLLTALPLGMRWNGWTGAVTGTDMSSIVAMDADKTVTASFVPSVVYVDQDNVSGPWDGLTWGTAFQDLESGVDKADAGGGGEVWVATGVYMSTTDPVLTMKPGVSIYGGFAGTESARDDRDWTGRVAIIDGEDARRCVYGASDAVLDGFTVTRGRADYGGGMHNSGSSPTVANCVFLNNSADDGGGITNISCSPVLTHCAFIGNTAAHDYGGAGGGIANSCSSPMLTDCAFTQNTAVSRGGGMHSDYASSPTLAHCTFTENTAEDGGGMANLYASPTLTECTFARNMATNTSMPGGGGGMYNDEAATTLTDCTFTENTAPYGGGMYTYSLSPTLTNCVFTDNAAASGGGMYNDTSSPTLTDCTFSRNSATSGGGMCNCGSSATLTNCVFADNSAASGGGIHDYFTLPTALTLTNCTLAGNSATSGGAMYGYYSSATLTNCILWGNTAPNGPEMYSMNGTPAATYSCVQGGWDGTGNIDTDPLFVNSGQGGSLQLRAGSPCIDTGTSAGAPAADLLGRVRPQGAGVDMGAYEGEVAPGDVVSLTVQVSPPGSGSTVPAAGTHFYTRNETVQLRAQPLGTRCNGWTGDVVSAEASVAVTMDADKTVTATFSTSVIYVDKDNASGPWNGRTWATAFQDVQSGVDQAQADVGGEVWVAEGTYTDDADAVVTMKPGIWIYGGFAGTETARDERDWTTRNTVIDGENARRCVNGANAATLDGFTLTRGTAENGGGMYIALASPVVAHCAFTDNTATSSGGGLYSCSRSSPTVTDCTFTGNTGGGVSNSYTSAVVTDCAFTGNSGDGMSSTSSSLVVTDCVFTGNSGRGMMNSYASASVTGCAFTGNSGRGMSNSYTSAVVTDCAFAANTGGGMSNSHSSPVVTDCAFTGNSGDGMTNTSSSSPEVTHCVFDGNASTNGGGMYNSSSSPVVAACSFILNTATTCAGGMYNTSSSCPTVTNCAFSSNAAPYGGGMYNASSSPPTVTNCTFGGNTALDGRAMCNADSSPIITNCIFWDDASLTGREMSNEGSSDPVVTYTCVQGGYAGEGNLDVDPRLVDGGRGGSLQLLAGSPCIDAGTATGAPATDIRGAARPQGGGVDMGAYEGIAAAGEIVSLTLQESPAGGGRTIPPVGTHFYVRGESALLGVRPLGMRWKGWTGSVVSTERQLSLAMNTDKAVTATFSTNIVYVDGYHVDGPWDGRTWATAFRDIQSGVDQAQTDTGGEVWVAAGVYTAIGDRVLAMKPDVSIYGGFAGGETSRSERNWTANATVINGENARRCVVGATGVVLDGFTLRQGASFLGGGMYNRFASPFVTHCAFISNTTTSTNHGGGGMYNESSSPTVTSCTFTQNTATNAGGAMYNVLSSSPRVVNCTFAENWAVRGGAISLYDTSSPTVTNCILWGDTAPNGAEIFDNSPSTAVVTYTCVQGGYAGANNIDGDPMFVYAPDNLQLQPGSPCFDTGTAATAPATDIRGAVRLQGAGVDMGAYEGNIYGLYAPLVTGTASPTLDQTPTWTWTSGGGMGLAVYRYGYVNGVWEEESVTTSSYTPAAPLPDGTYTLYVQERDADWNWSASGTYAILVDTEPPIAIVIQPEGGRIEVGDDFSFMVAATGGYGTLWYQWKKDGEAILGATEPVYTITDAVLGDSGRYAVEISDITGDIVESAPARLTVVPELPVASVAGLAALTAALAAAAMRRARRRRRRP